jgi:hypothetical protein
MRDPAFGLIIACLAAGPVAAEESAAEVIQSFGLVGTWSVDCKRDPNQACTSNGCGADDIHCAALGIADNKERDRDVFARPGADIHQHDLRGDPHRGRQDQVRVRSGSSGERRGGVVAVSLASLGRLSC